MDGLEAEFTGPVVVIRLNAGEPANQQLMSNYGRSGHPAFAVLDDGGNVVQRLFGSPTEAALREAMVAVSGETR